MNNKHNVLHVRRNLRTAAICLAATGALLAMVSLDATAQRRGGGGHAGGNGGRMAESSVAGANRSMTRPSGGNFNGGNRASTGAVNTGNRVNTGNVNTGNRVNVGNNVNVNIDGGYNNRGGYYGGNHAGWYHPVAAGVVIGAMAVTTAAVMGSYYYALPPSCTVVIKNGISYHYCGSVYYQQTWSGNDPVYIVVNP